MGLNNKSMLSFISKIKLWHRHRKLIKDGILIPVESYEQYATLVKDAKANSEHKLFSNCYMLPAEIKRLIALKKFYQVKTNTGLAFADDEGSYYYLFLYVDLAESLVLPRLEKDILVENVYYEGRKTELQCNFEQLVQSAGCVYLNTYNAVTDRPQLAPDKYWKKLEALQNSLAAEGKKICQPTERQLKEFERIYRETIDKYVQKRYSKKERNEQRKKGYLHCVVDKDDRIYAIQINRIIHGGAIATRKDCQGGIYSPGLMLYVFQEYYQNMPTDSEKKKEYMRPKGIGGWIAVNNKASWRLHKMLGIEATAKSMNQFVIKAKS